MLPIVTGTPELSPPCTLLSSQGGGAMITVFLNTAMQSEQSGSRTRMQRLGPYLARTPHILISS